jgi:DUF1365 family protein
MTESLSTEVQRFTTAASEQAAVELCQARVMHVRLRPFVHRFFYRVFCLRLRLDQPEKIRQQQSWLFGVERARPVSFHAKDHGRRDGTDLLVWLDTLLDQSGIALQRGAVWLQCFPRVFGYVFNPVSFWHVYDTQGVLRVILAEVNNTFGQRHQYVLTAQQLGPIDATTSLICTKVFHVSPFCAVEGEYHFKFSQHGQLHRSAIDYFDTQQQDGALLRTAIVIQSTPLKTTALLRSLLAMPLMTMGVMLRIHLQALKLWRKKAKYHSIPALPEQEVTSNVRSFK